LFFIAGISELCLISVQGEREYLKQLQQFYDLVVIGNADFEKNFTKTALFQRQIIYNN
jgi:hypothetical protein